GLALVVEDGPAAADPARIGICRRHHRLTVRTNDDLAGRVALRYGPRLRLDLLLDLAAEAVGVAEAELDLQALRRQRGVDVGFAGEHGGASGLPFLRASGIRPLRAAEAVEVVDDARGGVLEQRCRSGMRIGRVEEAVELDLREDRDETGER